MERKKLIFLVIGSFLLLFSLYLFIIAKKQSQCGTSVDGLYLKCGIINEKKDGKLLDYGGFLKAIKIKNDRVYIKIDFGGYDRDFMAGFMNLNGPAIFEDNHSLSIDDIYVLDDSGISNLKKHIGSFLIITVDDSDNLEFIKNIIESSEMDLVDTRIQDLGKIYSTLCYKPLINYYKSIDSNFFVRLVYMFKFLGNLDHFNCYPVVNSIWVTN